MPANDATYDIPLDTVVSHSPIARIASRQNGGNRDASSEETAAEKSGGLFHRGLQGRRLRKIDSKGQPRPFTPGEDEESTTLNRMGRLYYKILHFSVITRYLIYVSPLALAIAIPIIIGATVAQEAYIGKVRIVWFFTWIEIGKAIWIAGVVSSANNNTFSMAWTMGFQDRCAFPPKTLRVSHGYCQRRCPQICTAYCSS